MSVWAWCYEGRHAGTKPKYSRPCPGKLGDRVCACECHTETQNPKFPRKKKVDGS